MARSVARIVTLIVALERAWRKHPDMRLGQDPFYVEDDDMLVYLRRLSES